MTNNEIIFLHISKTGGTTLRSVIQKQYSADEIYDLDPSYFTSNSADYDRVFVERFNKLSKMPDIEKRQFHCFFNSRGYGLHNHLPQSIRYLTILRDPVDQAVSSYYFAVNRPGHIYHQLVKEKNLDLIGYLEHINFDNLQTRRLSGCDALDSPVDKKVELTDEIFEQACKNLREGIAVVGLLERFDESILMMQDAFGWGDVRYIPKNVAPKRKSLDEITQATKSKIMDEMYYDVQLYKVAQEKFEAQLEQQGVAFANRVATYKQTNEIYANRKKAIGRVRNILSNLKPW